MHKKQYDTTLALKKYRWQRGFSLIEIMVALVLGLIVMAAVIQVFLGTQQSGRVQQAASRMQENGRFAVDILTRYIRLAGYMTNPWEKVVAGTPGRASGTWDPNNGYRGFPGPVSSTADGANGPVAGFSQGFARNQVVMGGSANINGMDSIRIRYQGAADGSVTDCQGNTIAMNQVADITLSLTPDDTTNGTGRSLQCRVVVTQGSTGSPTMIVRTNQPIVAGLEDMRIWYGLSQGGTGVDLIGRLTGATTYLTAAQITSSNLWNRVIGVQISLLVRSDEDKLVDQKQIYAFPSTSTTTTTAPDLRLRYVVGAVTNIRNWVP